MKLVKTILIVLICTIFVSKSQFIEDALRYTIPNSLITPRSASVGVSYYGLSDDISGLFYNPAGLSFIGRSEFSIGLGFTRNIVESDYLFNKIERRSNSSFITHIGIAVPIEELKTPIIGAIGYFHENNYHNFFDYSAFNTKSSLIKSLTENGPRDLESNIPYHLWLANKDLKTPIKDSVQQNVFVNEDGGLHNITGGFSVLITENVSIGATLTGKFGTYKYFRDFSETDPLNKYNYFDSVSYNNLDFNNFTIKENIKQKVAGISGSIGVFATISDFFRFGASIKFPTYFQIEEEFRQDAYATFDNGWKPNPYEPRENLYNSYKITTPFVYAAGVSVKVTNFIFSGGIEYFDVTQLRFSDAPPAIDQLNTKIVRELVGQAHWGFGVIYSIPYLPLELRAGYSSITSPYTKDISNATTNILSLGAAIYVADNIRLEPTFQFLSNSILRTNYPTDDKASESYILKFNPMKISLQFTYRY